MSWLSLVGELIGITRPERAVSTTPMAYVRRFQTTEAEMAEAGWTLDRFRAARRDTEAKITENRLDTLRRESWALAILPRPLHNHSILSGKKVRVVGTPHPDDRVLMSVWAGFADGRIDRALGDHVHGFRRGRSVHSAVRAISGVRLPPGGALVRCDVRQMFPSLDHRVLLAAVVPLLGDDRLGTHLVGMLRQWLAAWSPGRGLPLGIGISPMLSNAYLAANVDPWILAERANGRLLAAARYADDFAMVTREPQATLEGIRSVLGSAKLVLNETKTRVVSKAGPWPEVVLGVPVELVDGVLRARPARSSPGRRKPA